MLDNSVVLSFDKKRELVSLSVGRIKEGTVENA